MISTRARTVSLVLCLAVVGGLLAVVGCDEDADAPTQSTGPVASETTEEEATTGEEIDLATANRAFAFALYSELRAERGNLFLSPYSVSAALAMTSAGARGETATQLADALRFDDVAEPLHTAFADLDATLNDRGEPEAPYEGEGFVFHVVNAMWTQSGYPFLDAFVETLTEEYGAGLRELDFASDPDGARETINDWVSEQTAERIENLIPDGAIDALTRLVLTNAIYFNAPWLHPFDPDATTTEPFARLDGKTVDVPMMHATETIPYATWEGGVAFELPYNGDELSMVVLVPDEGAFEAFDASLDVEVFDGIVTSLGSRSIALGFPRFEFTYATSLVDPLSRLGVTDAFDADAADFSGITGGRNLAISDVLHKSFVSVDEEGTEAAAATAVLFRATAMPVEPLELTVDRPFVFVIRDRPTGSVLFVGRVLEP